MFMLNEIKLEDLSWPPCHPIDVDKRFMCSKCKLVMVNVHQADDCGCLYCSECLQQLYDISSIYFMLLIRFLFYFSSTI